MFCYGQCVALFDALRVIIPTVTLAADRLLAVLAATTASKHCTSSNAFDILLYAITANNMRCEHRQRTQAGWHHERYTPLIAACAKGHVQLVTWLLNLAGIDINATNLLGQVSSRTC
jgi:Ankyrin repeats (many copies)